MILQLKRQSWTIFFLRYLGSGILFFIFSLSFNSCVWADITLKTQFYGITDPLLENAKSIILAKEQAYPKLTPDIVRKIYEESVGSIAKSLQPYGYFKAKITPKISLKGQQYLAEYYISLRQPMLISKVDIEIVGGAKNDPKFRDVINSFPLKKGVILDTTKYDKLKQDLFDVAMREGYIAAKIQNSQLYIDLNNNVANITLIFDSGPRHFFGEITFSPTNFSQHFLRKYLAIKSGDYYASDLLRTTQSNFGGSNLFQSVIVEPERQKIKNLQVPILVHLLPRQSKQYSLGAGYGTDTGFRGLLGFELYNINPIGQHLMGNIKAATNGEGTIELHYIIPGPNPITSNFDIGAATQILDENYGKSTIIKAGPGFTTIFHGWQQTIKLDFHHERWAFSDQDYENAMILVPNITWFKRETDDLVRPTNGYRLTILLQGALHDYGSNISFWQTSVDGKTMFKVPRGPIMILRGTFGYTGINEKDRNDLPLSYWFAAGGADSIRGYGYQTIGPDTQMFIGSLELRQKLFGDFYGSVFGDVGNVNNDIFSHDDPFYKHQGVGIGLVWLSPVGAIRLTYARAIDLPGAPSRVQFSMGPDL